MSQAPESPRPVHSRTRLPGYPCFPESSPGFLPPAIILMQLH